MTVFAVIAYKMFKLGKIKAAVITLAIGLASVFALSSMQVSYTPKGSVKPLSKVMLEASEANIKDNLLKPMSQQDRDESLSNKMTAMSDIKDKLKKTNQ